MWDAFVSSSHINTQAHTYSVKVNISLMNFLNNDISTQKCYFIPDPADRFPCISEPYLLIWQQVTIYSCWEQCCKVVTNVTLQASMYVMYCNLTSSVPDSDSWSEENSQRIQWHVPSLSKQSICHPISTPSVLIGGWHKVELQQGGSYSSCHKTIRLMTAALKRQAHRAFSDSGAVICSDLRCPDRRHAQFEQRRI